jgi:hypothetical protein
MSERFVALDVAKGGLPAVALTHSLRSGRQRNRVRRTVSALTAIVGLAAAGSAGGAQRPDSARATVAPAGAFVGFIRSSIDAAPVRSADVGLYFADSVCATRDSAGGASIETFIDTTRSRLGVSDSTGYFAIWRLAAGHYVMSVRRIGFSPAKAIVTVDTNTVLYDFAMEPLSPMLAKVEISATPIDRAGRRLDRVGFTSRTHFESGTFVKPAEIAKRWAQTLREILDVYGLRESSEYVFDRMPLDYSDIQDYPAELIAGIEIYRHGRPIEFNMTRRGANVLQAGGPANMMRALVVIWTYLP